MKSGRYGWGIHSAVVKLGFDYTVELYKNSKNWYS